MLARPSRGLVRAALRVYQTPKQLRVRSFSRLAELDEEIPGLPALSKCSAAPLTIETSTLPNGIKVVSTEYGKITNVGVAVSAGSRYEAVSEYGCAHVLQKLAFKATQSSTALRFLRNLEQVGSAPSAYAGRESLVYKVTALPEHAGDALAATFETVLTPKITDYGIHDLEETSIKVDLELLAASGQQQLIEALYEAAYGENTPLGHSFYATLAPSPGVLTNFREKTFIGPGFTVVGTGIPHAQLKSWASALTSDVAKDNTVEPPSSEYIGGEVRIKATSETTFVGLAFPAPPKAEAGALAVLAAAWSNALPAGATSFVLPGLVGVMGCAPYASAGGYVDNLLKVVKSSGGSFENAKNTAKVKELAKMDASTFEALAEGANPGAIDSVSESDVRSLQEKLWKSGVTIASIGNLSTVPRHSHIR